MDVKWRHEAQAHFHVTSGKGLHVQPKITSVWNNHTGLDTALSHTLLLSIGTRLRLSIHGRDIDDASAILQ